MLNQRAYAGVRGAGPDRKQCPPARYGGECARRALEQVGGHSRDVIAILPDAAVRVVLLDFDTLPDKPKEAEGVVRFRLRKSLPFDVDKAAVSYHAQTTPVGVRVIAAVCLNNVVQDYEGVFRRPDSTPA